MTQGDRRKPYAGPLSRQPARSQWGQPILLTPVVFKKPAPPCELAEYEKHQQYVNEGFRLLCDHYGIPWEDSYAGVRTLAFKLAEDHVPYFRPKHKKRQWTSQKLAQLILDVEEAKDRARALGKRASDPRACEELTESRRYRVGANTLYAYLHSARKDVIIGAIAKMEGDEKAFRKRLQMYVSMK